MIEPMPPALAGGFLTTEQSGKPERVALGLVFMDFDKCMTYTHRDSIIQSSFTALEIVYALPIHLHTPLTTTDLFKIFS